MNIIGIPEANLWLEDDSSSYKIKGYEIVPDKLFISHGRARAALYVKNSLRFSIRRDLMSDDFPDVWIEVQGVSQGAGKLLVGTAYREHTVVRGKTNETGSNNFSRQKERLQSWLDKLKIMIETENKEIILGGDFNVRPKRGRPTRKDDEGNFS